MTKTAEKCRKRRKEKKIKCFLSNKGYVVTTRMTVFSFLFILTQITCGGEEQRHSSTGQPQSKSFQRHHVLHYNDI